MDNRTCAAEIIMSVTVNATMTYPHFVLHANINVSDGECVAILGRNGSGKSTLFHAIAGLTQCTDGTISIDDVVVDAATSTRHFVAPESRHVGFLPQGGALFPHMTVADNVAFGLRARGDSKADSATAARAMLAQFDSEGLAEKLPHELSGGQRQRVALARTLVLQPRVLLLDEPTVALDVEGRAEVLTVINDVRTRFSGPLLFTSHDDRDVSLLATRSITISTQHDGHDTTSVLSDVS